jgi:uncharacterized protein (TIGR01777 family)
MSNTVDTNYHIYITGASGLIGSALMPFLKAKGYHVYALKRTVSSAQETNSPYWDIKNKKVDLNGCPNPDVIIHLAGENIAKSRWTTSVKQKITDSRIDSTQLMVDFINNSATPPSLFICASAIGFYGNRGQQPVDEIATKGNDFVSQLAAKWEKITQQIKTPSTRVVNLRTGIVLSKKEGALAKMLPAFKMGLGGKIGPGTQIMSWIDLQDELNAILFIIQQQSLQGPVNLVSPHSVDNKTFSTILARLLNRPSFFPMPAGIVRLLFGQMGEELLLSSTNVQPTKLLQAGFEFEYAYLEDSLKHQAVD